VNSHHTVKSLIYQNELSMHLSLSHHIFSAQQLRLIEFSHIEIRMNTVCFIVIMSIISVCSFSCNRYILNFWKPVVLLD